jgi:hypothetical protein
VSIVSPSAIGTPSLSETSCNARVASELETKLSGFPKSNDRQNALGSNGIGDGAGRAASALSGDSGALARSCGSALGPSISALCSSATTGRRDLTRNQAQPVQPS